ncbi:MAG TPA: gamma-glutamyl-gamma-aminobutyrate hydrolase family protein [Blastocatellia bacterium]|nr:gamma-glutamyl-gamma-aminobutyrate hydrolase family protein [Blastocatellia bacterium]
MSSSVTNPPSLPGRPLIGITTRLDPAENTYYLRRYYAEAVAAAGGVPVYIPLIADKEYLRALSARLDGLMLSGSNSDLDPVMYGEEPQPRLGSVIPERDETDLLLLEIAEERRLPVLGICFGMQSLNVARGGSLIQDIESQVPGAFKHEQGRPADRPSHGLKIEADSLLAQLAGREVTRVNSSHHQAVKDVGNNLRVIARAHDGVIEAVIDTRPDRFVLGVQWHPEVGWEKDKLSQAIFARFIEAAIR